MNRGRALELAIHRAARLYRTAGRCVLLKQEPRIATGAGGVLMYAGIAPIDFVGTHERGRCLAIEAKETGTRSLNLSRIRDEQQLALGLFHSFGADVRLICDFTALDETYSVEWEHVLEFLKAPWRASLSVEFFRAHGLELPRDNDGRLLFLNGVERADRAVALAALQVERSRPVVAEKVPIPTAQKERPPDTRTRQERILDACVEGIKRQSKKQTRRFIRR